MRIPASRILGTGLVICSGIYIYFILKDSLDQLQRESLAITAIDGTWLTLGILGTLVLSTIYHVLATRRLAPHTVTATRIGLAYALGQIVRYVPGKVFGVVFQVKFLSGKLNASTITLALIVQTIYDYLWTFAFAGAILLCSMFRTAWPLVGLVAIGIGIWRAHLLGWCERGLVWPGPIRRLIPKVHIEHFRSPIHSGVATLVLVGEWVPMLIGIAFALQGILGPADAVVLGSIYLLAAAGSLLVIVVPSGLVVREALFVWLGSRYGFEPSMLLFTGLILRASMTFAEVLNVIVFLAADAAHNRWRPCRPISD